MTKLNENCEPIYVCWYDMIKAVYLTKKYKDDKTLGLDVAFDEALESYEKMVSFIKISKIFQTISFIIIEASTSLCLGCLSNIDFAMFLITSRNTNTIRKNMNMSLDYLTFFLDSNLNVFF